MQRSPSKKIGDEFIYSMDGKPSLIPHSAAASGYHCGRRHSIFRQTRFLKSVPPKVATVNFVGKITSVTRHKSVFGRFFPLGKITCCAILCPLSVSPAALSLVLVERTLTLSRLVRFGELSSLFVRNAPKPSFPPSPRSPCDDPRP